MKFKSSIVAIAALSSMSFAGGDIGGVVDLGNKYDYVPAQAEYVAPVQEYVAPVQEYVAPVQEEYVAPYVAPVQEEYVAPYIAPAPAPYVAPAPAPAPAPYVAPAPTPAPYVAPPVVVTPKPTPKPVKPMAKPSGPIGMYVGGALAAMASRSDCEGNRANVFSEENGQDRQIGFTGILGYDFMKFLGAELRTSMGLAKDDYGTKMKQYGLYLKPNIDLGDALNLYGLIGYSTVNMSTCGTGADLDEKNSGLSYGAGLDYGVTENISVFTDVVNYLRDNDSRSTWGTNVGVKYKF